MIIETEDQNTWIIETGLIDNVPYKIYENSDGRKWITKGVCIACGACEPKIGNVGETIVLNLSRIKDGARDTYTRTLKWYDVPGKPNACIEENYEKRKDVPMTPDFKFDIAGCTLESEWIVK